MTLAGRAAAAALVLAGSAWTAWWLFPDPDDDDGEPAGHAWEAVLPPGWLMGWAPGSRYRYSFTFEQDSETFPAAGADGKPVAARVRLAGEIVVEPIGAPGPSGSRARWRLDKLEPAEFTVAGEELLGPGALGELATASAVVVLGPGGKPRAIQRDAGTTAMAARLFHLLASEWQLRVRGGERSWTAQERTQHGRQPAQYSIATVDRAAGTARLRKHREPYTWLQAAPGMERAQAEEGHASAVVSLAGHLLELDSRESLTLVQPDGATRLRSTVATRVKLVGSERAAVPGPEPAGALEALLADPAAK